jgi:hypothetical protein
MMKRVMLLVGAGLSLIGVSPVGSAGTPQQASETAIAGGPLVVRRLTEDQYRATVADIFGASIPVVGRFERGLREEGLLAIGTSHAGISPFSLEQYDASAQGVAGAILSEENRGRFVPCKPDTEAAFSAPCAQSFIEQYGRLLFRRPLSSEQTARYLKTAQAAHQRLGGFHKALQFTLAGMMVAPDFLLRIEQSEPDPDRPGQFRLDAYSRASRLSYFLINSGPDDELLRAAGAGELNNDAGLAKQADRLIASPKFERAVRAFFYDMLELDAFGELAKDPAIFPAFNSRVAADAQEQTLRTIVDHLIARRGDYRALFTTRNTFLTRPLGIVYRLPVTIRNGWEPTEYPPDTGRAGILTNMSFLALYAHPGASSPTLRGKFIRQAFLCQRVPDPPPNVDFSKFEGPKAVMPTARLRLADHNANPACAGCHKLTDPLGLTLENFDGVGIFRLNESGSPIDASGSLDGVPFKGAAALGKALHDNPQTSACLVQKLYQSAVGHAVSPGDAYLESLDRSFAGAGYRVPDLMRTLALSPTFYLVTPPVPTAPSRTASNPKNGDRS